MPKTWCMWDCGRIHSLFLYSPKPFDEASAFPSPPTADLNTALGLLSNPEIDSSHCLDPFTAIATPTPARDEGVTRLGQAQLSRLEVRFPPPSTLHATPATALLVWGASQAVQSTSILPPISLWTPFADTSRLVRNHRYLLEGSMCPHVALSLSFLSSLSHSLTQTMHHLSLPLPVVPDLVSRVKVVN